MRRSHFWALAALFLTITPVLNAHADPALECDGTSQVEIRDCLSQTLERADAAVQQALEFARSSAQELDDVTERAVVVPALEASQAAWEAFRDSQCDYVGSTYGGGSGTGVAILACRVTAARERAADLLNGLN